jgi:hypothetical protein
MLEEGPKVRKRERESRRNEEKTVIKYGNEGA